jgi:hypothetical protein
MKKLLALSFLTLSLHLPSALAEPATTDSVKQLMETTGSTQMSRQIVQQMIPMLKKLVPDAPDDFWDSFMKEINPEQINALVIPIYQKYLNEEDVQKINAFYETPTGQKLLKVQPKIARESMQAGQAWGREIAQKVLTEYEKSQRQATPPPQDNLLE